MKEVVVKIFDFGVEYVLIKGGSKLVYEKVIDLFYDGKMFEILEFECIEIIFMYGVGCIYLVVIVVELVKGSDVK